jgi:hypothetical protein
MKIFIYGLACLVTCVCLRADDAVDLADLKEVPGMINPRTFFPMTDEEVVHYYRIYYVILNYKPEYIERFISLSLQKDPPGDISRAENALGYLRLIAPRDHQVLSFEKIKNLIEKLEVLAAADESYHERLRMSYDIMAYSGYPQALDFLEQRASFEFWQDKKMPYVPPGPPWGDTYRLPQTAQDDAIYAIVNISSPEAEAFLRKCQQDPRYMRVDLLKNSLDFILEHFFTENRAETEKNKLIMDKAWAKRAELLKGKAAAVPTPDATPRSIDAAQSKATATTAQTPTSKTTPSGSLPLYILLGAIVLGGGLLLLRRK